MCGAELTARMHHRGLVKKRLFAVRITGPAPAFGSNLLANGKEVGDMRSRCGDVGLAMVNSEKAQEAMDNQLPMNCGISAVGRQSWQRQTPQHLFRLELLVIAGHDTTVCT